MLGGCVLKVFGNTCSGKRGQVLLELGREL